MHLKIINIFFTLGLILAAFSSQAQMFPDLVEYIVTEKGDTILGEVRVFDSYNVEFRAKGEDDFIKLDPYKIKKAVEGENFYYLSEELTYEGKTSKVFLKELISGNVAFFEFEDSNSDLSYYVKKENDKFRRLNTLNYNSIKNALLMNCDSIPSKKINMTKEYRFNIVVSQISMHNASCSSTENPFKIKYGSRKRSYFEIKAGFFIALYQENYVKGQIYAFTGPETSSIAAILGFNLGIGYMLGFTPYFFWNPDLSYVNTGGQFQSSIPYMKSEHILLTSNIVDFSPLQFVFRTNKMKFNPNCSIGTGYRFGINNPRSDVSWSSLMLSLGIGFDHQLADKRFIKVSLNYKLFPSDMIYPPSANSFNEYTLDKGTLGVTMSYFLN